MFALFMALVEKLKGFFYHKKKRSFVTRAIKKVESKPDDL